MFEDERVELGGTGSTRELQTFSSKKGKTTGTLEASRRSNPGPVGVALTVALLFIHVKPQHHHGVAIKGAHGLLPWRSCSSRVCSAEARLHRNRCHNLSATTGGGDLVVKLLRAFISTLSACLTEVRDPQASCLVSWCHLQFILLLGNSSSTWHLASPLNPLKLAGEKHRAWIHSDRKVTWIT